ncbi:glycosyl hydrolase [Nocardioides psychrotolerans]|uniref:Beta-glucosidase n=1 Tax=Nocardioides psychrotolerans TaxID=1005945 RepID=A0A1I3REJ9_9ACTN|nr:glycoside hydrolase family 3 C-terminal domain-containing protein [Nocardioides psychrotolerans]GEP40431.1 glycosyl hydrolase [Nocardioides psychrotolerans]SFJ44129.1 beta-glucosidase [Nocardioides psychrotolerans]
MIRPALATVLLLMASALTIVTPATTAQAVGVCGDVRERPWCDTRLSADKRAGLVLTRLTLEEKIALLGGDELMGAAGGEGTHTGTSNGLARLGIPTLYFSDGPVGTRQGMATQMPSPMSVASSFSPVTSRATGVVIADEARKKGNHVVFAPGVNIGRTPLNGRTFEYYGEDPYLAAQLGVGFIRGIQSQGLIANVKHYAVNNQEGEGYAVPGSPLGAAGEGNRLFVNAVLGERALREIYLPAFEAAVKDADVGTVMCSYNRVNGSYGCENEHLLVDILKREWGFKGFVLTDYGAAKNALNSLNNGLDLDIWPGFVYNPVAVRALVATSQVSTDTIDDHVRRILRTMFAYGIFDAPAFTDDASRIDVAAHHARAASIEAQGMVLLKNERSLLPLSQRSTRTLAVIGPEADLIRTGGGSSDVKPLRRVTPLEGLRQRLGAARILYDDGSDAARAAAVARRADAAVVVVGDKMTEGSDKAAPTLNAGQMDGIDRDALIAAVAAAQPRTVAVLQSGGPVLTPWRDRVPAILEAWYPGQNVGTALARVLFGDAEPGGRLPMTFPRRARDLPTAGDRAAYPGIAGTVHYKEGVMVGYRHFDERRIAPAYAFGHGLGYTTFRFSRPVLRRGTDAQLATVTFRVTNTGKRSGAAVPQVYVGMPSPGKGTPQPPKQLKGFSKVRLAPGASRTVTIELDRRSFSYWDTAADGWRVARGCYDVMLARSSRDITGRARAARSADCGPGALTLR